MISDEEYRRWWMHVMNYYGTYHHHKETMAWAATAFFIPSVISFAIASGHIGNEHCVLRIFFPSIWLVIPVIVILLAGAWALYFVEWQFSKRQMASENVGNALKRLRSAYSDKFIKFDDPPEGYVSEKLSRLAIAGTTVIAVVIVIVGIF